MTKTYALYLRPRGDGLATRIPHLSPVHSASSARAIRSRLRQDGVDALIHVGEEHPDPLPHGETLWQDPGGPIPEPKEDLT